MRCGKAGLRKRVAPMALLRVCDSYPALTRRAKVWRADGAGWAGVFCAGSV